MSREDSGKQISNDSADADKIIPVVIGWPEDGLAGQSSRVSFHSDSLPRRITKNLKKTARDCGFQLKLIHSFSVTARVFGYKHWPDLLDSIDGKHDTQEYLDEDAVERRYVPRLASVLRIKPDQALAMFNGVRRLMLLVHTPFDADARAASASTKPVHHPPKGPIVVMKKRKLKIPVSGKLNFDLS